MKYHRPTAPEHRPEGGLTVYTEPRQIPLGFLRRGDQIRPWTEVQAAVANGPVSMTPKEVADLFSAGPDAAIRSLLAKVAVRTGVHSGWHTIAHTDLEAHWPGGHAHLSVFVEPLAGCSGCEVSASQHGMTPEGFLIESVSEGAITDPITVREPIRIDPWDLTDDINIEAQATPETAAA